MRQKVMFIFTSITYIHIYNDEEHQATSRLDNNNNNNNNNNVLLFVFIFDNRYNIGLLYLHHHYIVHSFDILFTYVPYLDNVFVIFSYSYIVLTHIEKKGLLPIVYS